MSADYFLKIDGIDGEATDGKHKNEIEVQSFRWSEAQNVSFGTGGGGGAGKVAMGTFDFTMRANKASPKLLLACATGSHIKNAILTCRKAGKDQQEFYKLTFTDILVASYTTSSGNGPTEGTPGSISNSITEVPVDHVSFAFGKIESEYRAQKQDGSLDNPIKTGYDLEQNQAV
jgi:type VI secretion system secreted protein Hcp